MKSLSLVFSLPLLLNCGSPEQCYDVEIPPASIDMKKPDLKEEPKEDRLEPFHIINSQLNLMHDKKLDIYCIPSNGYCLPIETHTEKLTNDCNHSLDNVFVINPGEEILKNNIGYTKVDGKYFTAQVVQYSKNLYTGSYFSPSNPTAFCKYKGLYNIFLIWPEKEVDPSIFATLPQ